MPTEGRASSSAPARLRSSTSPVTLAQVGVIIALLAVSAQVSVAIGPVPFTLQTLVVVLAALVLTPAQAAAALGGYVLLGALGLPIFSLMRGGLAVIAGPTGGYLYGFILSAFLGALIRRLIARRVPRRGCPNPFAGVTGGKAKATSAGGSAALANPSGAGRPCSAHAASADQASASAPSRARTLAGDIACAVIAVLVCYAIGTAHFMLTAHVGLAAALGTAVLPFIIPDVLKCIAAVLVATTLRRAIPTLAVR